MLVSRQSTRRSADGAGKNLVRNLTSASVLTRRPALHSCPTAKRFADKSVFTDRYDAVMQDDLHCISREQYILLNRLIRLSGHACFGLHRPVKLMTIVRAHTLFLGSPPGHQQRFATIQATRLNAGHQGFATKNAKSFLLVCVSFQ